MERKGSVNGWEGVATAGDVAGIGGGGSFARVRRELGRLLAVVGVGISVNVLTLLVLWVVISGFGISYELLGGSYEEAMFAEQLRLFIEWGPGLVMAGLSVWAGARLARWAGERPVMYGVLAGASAASVYEIATYLWWPPISVRELGVQVALSVAGGYLGGLEARGTLASQEQLYRATRQIARAEDPGEVAAAVGENIGGMEATGVVLWRDETRGQGARGRPGVMEVVGSWTRDGQDRGAPEPWPAGARLDVAGEAPAVEGATGRAGRAGPEAERGAVLVRRAEVSGEEAGRWGRDGARMALVLRLDGPGGRFAGALMVTFSRGRRLRRRLLRQYDVVAVQAELKLENVGLLEDAREVALQRGFVLERERLAHGLHDSLANGFSGIKVSLEVAENHLGKGPPGPGLETGEGSALWHIGRAREMAQGSISEARRLMWALSPPESRGSLSQELAGLAHEWSERAGIRAEAAAEGSEVALRPEAESYLLRAAEEALKNVEKHANAARVAINLTYAPEAVILDVSDDGRGFDPAGEAAALRSDAGPGPRDGGGYGLPSVRKSVERLGGSLGVESEPGEGASVVVELPMPECALNLRRGAGIRDTANGNGNRGRFG